MAKITLTDLTSLANDTSAVNSLNENFQSVENYINNNVLSRVTGVETNTMQNDIDMNSFSLTNVANINNFNMVELEAELLAQIAYAEEWAITGEDTLVSVAAGGNGTTEYSSFHWAQKSADEKIAAQAAQTAAVTAQGLAETAQGLSEAAQVASEAALDEFTDLYLGTKAANPTVDNDGNPLQTGALYYNSVTEALVIYDGAIWQPAAFDVGTALFDADIGVTVQGYDVDTAKTDVEQTFTAAQTGSTQVNATATGPITLDFSLYNNFILTLTDNITLANPTTETIGQSGFITFIQDATGTRTLTLGTDFENVGGTAPTLTTTANATDVIGYCVIGANRILLGSALLDFS